MSLTVHQARADALQQRDERKIPLSHLVVLLLFPMGLICSLIFYWPLGALGALPAFAAAWLFAGAFCCFMCKSMGRQAVLIPVLVFFLGHAVALGVARENLGRFGGLDTGSDDHLYLSVANGVTAQVRQSPWDIESAKEGIRELNYSGYPLLLGYLFAPLEDSDSVRIAAATAVNLCAVCLVFFSVVYLAQTLGPVDVNLMLLIILASMPEFLYFSSLTLKDCIVVALMAGIVLLLDRLNKLSSFVKLGLLIVLGTALWNLRAPYVLISFCALPLWVAARQKSLDRPAVTLLVGASLALLYSMTSRLIFSSFPSGVSEVGYGAGAQYLVTTGFGYGAKLYKFPVIGPIVFWMVSPVPLNPLSLSKMPYFTDVLRSIGTLLSLGLLFAAFRGKLFRMLWQPIFLISLSMYGLMIFVVAMGATEARHKLAAAPFLALMAYATSFYLKNPKALLPPRPSVPPPKSF
jgi:hypothetical protein